MFARWKKKFVSKKDDIVIPNKRGTCTLMASTLTWKRKCRVWFQLCDKLSIMLTMQCVTMMPHRQSMIFRNVWTKFHMPTWYGYIRWPCFTLPYFWWPFLHKWYLNWHISATFGRGLKTLTHLWRSIFSLYNNREGCSLPTPQGLLIATLRTVK